jgi:hypothetical protein
MFVPLNQSTMAQSFFAVCLLDHLKRFASRFAYFLAELDMVPLLKVQHSLFPPIADKTTLLNRDFLSQCTTCMQLLLVRTREERTQHHLVAPRIRCRCHLLSMKTEDLSKLYTVMTQKTRLFIVWVFQVWYEPYCNITVLFAGCKLLHTSQDGDSDVARE